MPMHRENIELARRVLEGSETLEDAGQAYGKTRGRAWQIVRAFCLERMMLHERLGDDGKLKDLNELRDTWRNWARV